MQRQCGFKGTPGVLSPMHFCLAILTTSPLLLLPQGQEQNRQEGLRTEALATKGTVLKWRLHSSQCVSQNSSHNHTYGGKSNPPAGSKAEETKCCWIIISITVHVLQLFGARYCSQSGMWTQKPVCFLH